MRDYLIGTFHLDPQATGAIPLTADSPDSPGKVPSEASTTSYRLQPRGGGRLSTVQQELHDIPVHEAHFAQVEHDVARPLRLNGSAQVRQLLSPDSPAHNQRGA